MSPIYRASATLQITQDNPGSQVSAGDKLPEFFTYDTAEKFQQTQYDILQSQSLTERVIQALNLPKDTPWGVLEVNPVRNTYLVEVAFQSPDNKLAQRVVNTIADEYMYLSIDRRNESFALVKRWLSKQLREMAAKVQEAQKKLYKFGQKTDIYASEDKDNVVVQKFIDLSSLLTKAQAEKMAKEAQFNQIKEEGPNSSLIVNNPLIAALRQQLVSQETKISALKKVYRSEHPEMLAEQANLAELRSRLQTEVGRLQESAKADYEAANRTEKLLSGSLTDQKGEMAKLQDNLTDFQILKRDAQTNEQLYQALLARVKEASIAGTMVPSNVAVIDPAQLPTQPFLPNTRRDLTLAAIMGLTVSVGLAFLLEHLDDSIQSTDDLERTCNLPRWGCYPCWAATAGCSRAMGQGPGRRVSGAISPGSGAISPGSESRPGLRRCRKWRPDSLQKSIFSGERSHPSGSYRDHAFSLRPASGCHIGYQPQSRGRQDPGGLQPGPDLRPGRTGNPRDRLQPAEATGPANLSDGAPARSQQLPHRQRHPGGDPAPRRHPQPVGDNRGHSPSQPRHSYEFPRVQGSSSATAPAL